jgi:hypothetical protein
MKKLFLFALLVACLSADARRVKVEPSLATSCTVCDSSQLVEWGDGTYRSVIEVAGAGYAPGALVRVEWADAQGPLWSFDCLTYADGSFSEVWTDVPAGVYTLTASQPRNKVKFDVMAITAVTVL